jgi:hypothetical protein
MGLRHHQTIIAERSDHPSTLCTAVYGNKLTYAVSGADPRFGRLILVLKILWREANGNERVHMRVVTNEGPSVDDYMSFQAHAVTQDCVVTYDRIGANITIAPDSRFRTHYCRGMNFRRMRN